MSGFAHAFQHQPRWKKSNWRPKGHFRIDRKTVIQELQGNWRGIALLNILKAWANVGESEVRAHGTVYRLQDGGLVTSIRKMATQLRWAPETVRKNLQRLAAQGIVKVERPPEGHIIYVCDAVIQPPKHDHVHPRSLLHRSINNKQISNRNEVTPAFFVPGAEETKRFIIIDDDEYEFTEERLELGRAAFDQILGRKR